MVSQIFRLLMIIAALCLLPGLTAANEPLRILALGDSLTAGFGLKPSDGFTVQLQRSLAARGISAVVLNAGVSGDTTAGGLSRLPQALEQFQPDILIIELGGNDGLRGLGNDQTRDHLDQMITLARAAHSRPLLLGMMLPPNFGKAFTEKFLQIYRDLAEQRRVPLVPFFLEGVADRPDWMQGDGIHPNAAGQPLMLEHVWTQLQPLLDEEMAGGMGSAHSPTILK